MANTIKLLRENSEWNNERNLEHNYLSVSIKGIARCAVIG